MKEDIGIVLIHGAGLDGFIWDNLITEMDVPILATDFPNRGSMGKPTTKLHFDDYVNTVNEQILNWYCKKFIIVGHSIGACVGLKVSNHFKNELKGFAAISSVIPTRGKSFISALPFPQNLLMPVMLNLFGTKPPQKTIENKLCYDISVEQTELIVDGFTPEAKALYTDKINYSLPGCKRLYIKLTNDKSMPIGLQERMAVNFEADLIANIESGHLPMLSKPKRLAKILSIFTHEVATDESTSKKVANF